MNIQGEETSKKSQQLDSALFKRLDQLLMKIPKDPSLYAEPVSQHTITFQQQFKNLLSDTQRKNQRFGELVTFMARCSRHYPKSLGFLGGMIMDLLNNYGAILHPYNRRKAVGCIFILRARNLLFPVSTIQFLLKLMNLQDKQLRKVIYRYVLNDIKRMNKHHKNQKINQGIRSFIQSYTRSHGDKAAQKCIRLMIDLYRRDIWTDGRSVNIIAQACLNQSPKVRLLSAHFLLDTTQKPQELSDSEDEGAMGHTLKGITKKTKNRQKNAQKQKKKAARKLRKKELHALKTNYMPIDLIYSPQDFCEKVFTYLSGKAEKFNHRLVFMGLVARMIWRHQLIILPFYGFLMKYMQPQQKEVPRVLAAFAQSLHENIPDDEVEGIIKHIAEKFVNDKCPEFAMTIGLNTIREAVSKIPSLLNEDMVQYLCTYYDYKNRNVSTAAKALINLVRRINPEILEKKYRGKPGQNEQGQTQLSNKNAPYRRIVGADLLPNSGQMPIEMDRVLTDEDFKMIRKLRRKQQQQMQEQQIRKKQELIESKKNVQQNGVQQQQSQQNEQEDEQEDEQEQKDSQLEDHGEQGQNQDQNQEELEIQDCEQLEDQGDSAQEDEESDQEDESGSQIEQLNEIDWNDAEQIEEGQPKNNKQKNKIDKQKRNKNLYSDNDSDQQSEQDVEDARGFIPLNRIAFYKKSKTEIKAQKRNTTDKETKFKHTPKQKKGGSNDKEKQKFKPLMMLRAKKNRSRNREKQVKIRIKDLKNKLGKIRSNKQAKKAKNKKVKMN